MVAVGGTPVAVAVGGTVVDVAVGGTVVEVAVGGTLVDVAVGGTVVGVGVLPSSIQETPLTAKSVGTVIVPLWLPIMPKATVPPFAPIVPFQ